MKSLFSPSPSPSHRPRLGFTLKSPAEHPDPNGDFMEDDDDTSIPLLRGAEQGFRHNDYRHRSRGSGLDLLSCRLLVGVAVIAWALGLLMGGLAWRVYMWQSPRPGAIAFDRIADSKLDDSSSESGSGIPSPQSTIPTVMSAGLASALASTVSTRAYSPALSSSLSEIPSSALSVLVSTPTAASPSSSPSPNPDTILHALAAAPVDALLSRQSITLTQASARYTLHNNRPPPPSYDRWFRYAREKHCLIDDYEQVYRDFKVFYDIAKEDEGYFRRRVDRAAKQIEGKDAGISRVEIVSGRASFLGHTAYDAFWPNTFTQFRNLLLNTTVLMNGRDEPRVAFNYRALDASTRIRDPGYGWESIESGEFAIAPHPTEAWFAQLGCEVPLEQEGLMRSANPSSGFMLSAVTGAFTTELYPMLSMAKVSPCFADILFPTEFYYTRTWWYQPFVYPDNIPWEKKLDKAYWRGGATNGLILPNSTTYHSFPRFRLASLSQLHPSHLDARITTFPPDTHCFPPDSCNASAIMAEYNITGTRSAREEVYRYKYVVDVDGATFSGRFWGLLRSGSLVFKVPLPFFAFGNMYDLSYAQQSTIFSEFFNSWVRPNEHYIAVLPDLSDLIEKIEWANANPEEARLIQLRGLEVAQRVLSDAQNDCYFANVLMHWEELMGFGEPEEAEMDAEEKVVDAEDDTYLADDDEQAKGEIEIGEPTIQGSHHETEPEGEGLASE
ncbi:hypothetical protein C8F01DRAFT_101184 [Mycena amicta]|nr:hypothetical protein C8F01DRAFT_101184 [Mycena amicta]